MENFKNVVFFKSSKDKRKKFENSERKYFEFSIFEEKNPVINRSPGSIELNGAEVATSVVE